jgi:hypothetical protein
MIGLNSMMMMNSEDKHPCLKLDSTHGLSVQAIKAYALERPVGPARSWINSRDSVGWNLLYWKAHALSVSTELLLYHRFHPYVIEATSNSRDDWTRFIRTIISMLSLLFVILQTLVLTDESSCNSLIVPNRYYKMK